MPRRAGAPRAPSVNRVRDLILELWTRTRIDWGFASNRLAAALREARFLRSTERREVAETLYGMIRQARRIDFALETAHARLPAGSQRELARYLAFRLLEGGIAVEQAGRELPNVDWQAVATVDERIAEERNPVARLGLSRSLPDWLAERWLNEFGEEAEALAQALNQRGPLTLRTNTLRIDRDPLLERLRRGGVEARAATHAPAGIVLTTHADVWSLASFKEGLFEVQDEASQLVAELVAPPPKSLVLDACAGAGGKTLALGCIMQGKGRLLAADIDERKLGELRKRARRAGLSSVQAMQADAGAWPTEVGALMGRFDRVLVDAPCSGTGSLRRNPEIRWRTQPDDVERLVAQQDALLSRAASLVAPGGRLIYATCSLLRVENEGVVERWMAGRAGWQLVRAAEIWGKAFAAPLCDASGTFLKTLPHRLGTDGFFAAVMRKRGE